MEGNEKEKSCLSAIYVNFSKKVERDISQRKLEDEFFQMGVSNVGENLLIFSVKTKIEKMSEII
jgi:hypothetical protein